MELKLGNRPLVIEIRTNNIIIPFEMLDSMSQNKGLPNLYHSITRHKSRIIIRLSKKQAYEYLITAKFH